MIDWHSHVLPGVDDGSRDLDESLEMLDALIAQGVDTVIATPHFYANEEPLEEFLSRRQSAMELLKANIGDRNIKVKCGAEVRYYPGISRMDDLKKLTVENTNLLLLEMPFARWTDLAVKELTELANTRGIKVVMAHIERYLAMQEKGLLKKLWNSGILVQVNSSFFERIGTRRRAMRLLGEGYVQLVGSDCHNMTTRPPKLGSAYELIEKKLGEEFTSQMIAYSYEVMGRKLQQ